MVPPSLMLRLLLLRWWLLFKSILYFWPEYFRSQINLLLFNVLQAFDTFYSKWLALWLPHILTHTHTHIYWIIIKFSAIWFRVYLSFVPFSSVSRLHLHSSPTCSLVFDVVLWTTAWTNQTNQIHRWDNKMRGRWTRKFHCYNMATHHATRPQYQQQ